ncbi:MAG: tRNA pseudouridine(38-40) synthase TruA [Actinomycetota bacterium]|jgi:tRNA pseudouridine38-40 synthase
MTRLRLDLAYDGTAYSGWARQPDLRTVQGVVEAALTQALRLAEPVAITCAGRTDAGVHARGQVAHADVPREAGDLDLASLARSVRGLLPNDVWLRALAVAPDGFDARFSALSRRYSYRVCDDVTSWDPLRRHDTLQHPRALDLDAMNEAAQALVGEHDFAALCKPRDGASTVRTLLALSWSRDEDGVAVMSVSADAFCHSMVRALVGVLVPVGDGRRPVVWPGDVVARGERDSAVQVMPPHPLTLEEVRYPADADLAARQSITRAHRGQ